MTVSPVKQRECVVCGTTFVAARAPSRQRRKTGDQYQRTCSRECGYASIARSCCECGEPSGAKKRCAACRAAPTPPPAPQNCRWCGRPTGSHRRSYCCRAHLDIATDPRRARVTHIRYGDCRECGALFVTRAGKAKLCCSDACATRAAHRNRRHRERSAGKGLVGSITLRELADRDGWRCHLCGKPVPDRESKARPLDPTIDHLIPLSEGGHHTPENVALAHFRCNWQRGTGGQVQLRLAA